MRVGSRKSSCRCCRRVLCCVYQKSNCALILKSRGSRIDCGVLHAVLGANTNVAFSVSTELELVRLYRSKFTLVRAPANLNSFATRKSIWFNRSIYTSPAFTML